MPPPDTAHHLVHPKYRPDIDGLRAIAVLSVVWFHASPRWMPGGFVGVDIFFVISGYLISTIILGSLGGEGFSYREFYARRIRRIFPALLVVMACTLAFGWYVLLSDEFAQLGRHLLASAAFVVNLVFWGEAGYFDTLAETKPLLHLWSLAVEEQFYIFWPLLLALGWRSRRYGMALWIGGALVLSFLLNVALVRRWPDAAFYLPLPRFWELAAGALLAHANMRLQPHRTAVRRELRSIAGLLLIALSLVLVHKDKAFPGWWAVMPTLGTCLVISAGPGAWLNKHLLGMRGLVWVGLISYPLYLWHWPLLAYARIVQGPEPTRSVRIAAVLASLLLAWLTWRFVERGLRRRPGAVVTLASGMVLLALLGALIAARLVPPRNDDANLQAIAAAGTDWTYPDGLRPVQIEGQKFFRLGQGKRRVLLMGDSHIEQYAARAEALAKSATDDLGTLTFATRGACPPIPNLLEDRDPSCGPRMDAALRYALSPSVDTVVIGGCWPCYFDIANTKAPAQPGGDHYYYLENGARHPLRGGDGVQRSLEALAAEIRQLRDHGKQVYLLLSIPVGEAFEPKSLITGSRFGTMRARHMSPTTPLPASQRALHDRMRQLALDNGAIPIDPLPRLCPGDDACLRADPSGKPIYKDVSHLRATFVQHAADYLDPAIVDTPAHAATVR